MNPNENNPSSPASAGGAAGGVTPTSSTIPSPVDFTNPSSLNTNTSSLSMSDSLASAQDNLTSAGQAANGGASTAVGLDQLDMNSGAATMDHPGAELKPADPVPGSIGSVTSVPPLVQEPMDMNAFGNATTAASPSATPSSTTVPSMATSTPTTSAMPVMGGGATTPTAGATSATGFGNTSTAAGASATKPVQPYYNPFARTMGGNTTTTAPTSSTNVPPALQPQTEKFSARLNGAGAEKKKSNIVALLGWLLAALFAVTTVVFLILWMGAKDNERIIYRDPVVPETPVTDTVSLMSCTQDIVEPVVEGLENLTGERKEVNLRFVNDVLNKVDLANIYTFTDEAAAEAARGYFDGQTGWFGEIATNLGVTAITTGLNIEGNTARFDLSATNENLAGDYIGVFSLTANEDGKLDTSVEGMRQNYTNAGFVCSAE